MDNEHLAHKIMFYIKIKETKFNDGLYGYDGRFYIIANENKYYISHKEMKRKIKQQLLGEQINPQFIQMIKNWEGFDEGSTDNISRREQVSDVQEKD